MNKDKKELIGRAYTTMDKNGKTINIPDTNVVTSMADQNAIMGIQERLNVDFEQSYEIMADACSIIADMEIKDLENPDFFAEADSRASVYTGVQLSYLNISNETEISDLLKDEGITSIALACSIWYSQKVAEACDGLLDFIKQ